MSTKAGYRRPRARPWGGRVMNKDEAYRRRHNMALALQGVADVLGKNESVTKAMGTVAWGRYEGEPSNTDSKDNVVFGYGYLRGVRDALLQAARVNGWKGERLLANVSWENP